MKAIPFFLSLIFVSQLLNAQLKESFDDGNFSSDPAWIGNTNHFIINGGWLQLNNPEADGTSSSFLAVEAPTSLEETTVWRFSFQLQFSPSATNQLRIYLAAGQSDLRIADQAYYLQIGESGSQDAIALYVQNQDDIQLLGKGTLGAVAAEPINVRVEVRRSPRGKWTVFADYSGSGELQEEFTATDSTFSVLNYFGFLCRYSATRSDAFFFDDITIAPLYVDRVPPAVVAVEAITDNQVRVSFGEALEAGSAKDPFNYSVNNGIGRPESIRFEASSPTIVWLNLASELISTQEYTLSISGVQDLNQNTLSEQTHNFVFYDIRAAAAGDLIVSEILADPSPSEGLPEAEFFELYNFSDKVLQLNELMISSGPSFQRLPDYLLLPGAYVAVCDDDDLDAFSGFGPAVAVRSLPSLSNSDNITISDLDTNLIFTLSYEQSWYGSSPLPQGGISLEMIDPAGPADCPGNWTASRNPAGGTPGIVNSVDGLPPENIAPVVKKVEVVDELEIRITFSERMDANSVMAPSAYSFSPSVEILEVLSGMDNEVIILTASPLSKGQSYVLKLSDAIQDCIGNSLGTDYTFLLGVPEQAVPGDLLLSEILFNPQTGGEDFIELFNRSDKVIDLKGWTFENTSKESGNTIEGFESHFLVFPGEYIALSSEPEDILMRYQVLNTDRLVKNDLPTLDAKEGNITLKRADNQIIDAFDYDEDMHFALLENLRGVSLERLSFDQPTQSRGNWHSAAESVGFATPTAPNSQRTVSSQDQGLVNIDNPRFSPDNDGFEDVLLIGINPNRTGYVGNIKIFDAQGRLVRDLVRNATLGSSEVFKWDGWTNESSKARIGPYVVWVELFEPGGEVFTEKKTVVVAGKL